MARRSHRRSTSLARRTVSVKPVVIRQTKLVKSKRRHHRGGGGLGLGGFLGGETTSMLLAGAALGLLDKSAFIATLPKLPFLGEHGTIAVGAYLLGGKVPLLRNISRGAMFLAAYEMTKLGAIQGVEPMY